MSDRVFGDGAGWEDQEGVGGYGWQVDGRVDESRQ